MSLGLATAVFFGLPMLVAVLLWLDVRATRKREEKFRASMRFHEKGDR